MGTLKEAVNYWIVEHFCLADEVILEEPIPELASEMFLRFGDKRVPINNVGFGTSQIIPVIYEILSNISSMLCFVDEPEIHLHPSAQSKLADFFFQMGLLGKKVFVETHSEYLIDKAIFLKLKSQQLSPQMKMVWVKKDSNDSFIEEIIHDNLGFIINAPEGFLSEKNNLSAQMSEMRFKSI
jgi:predicted ATPase